jgi:DNA polymerase V
MGNSMVGAGSFDGDLLMVDKSLFPASGDIVIAVVDGDLTVKRLIKRGEPACLPTSMANNSRSATVQSWRTGWNTLQFGIVVPVN